MVLDHGPAVGDGLAEAREAAILIGAVSRVVPADEVKELVAGRGPHLPQALVRLDTGREPDLVAIGPVAPTAASVVPKERTAPTESAHIRGKAFERALDEERTGRDVQICMGAP